MRKRVGRRIMPRMARVLACVAVIVALVVAPRVASAQQYLLGASGELASGVEGGGSPGVPLQIGRTRIRLGLDLRVDEFPKDIYGLGLILDIEPRASFGLDVRYMRRLGPKFEVSVGAIGYLMPATLIGPSASLSYRIPLSPVAAVTVGPELNIYVLGSDLPDGTVVWQGLLQVGIHADL